MWGLQREECGREIVPIQTPYYSYQLSIWILILEDRADWLSWNISKELSLHTPESSLPHSQDLAAHPHPGPDQPVPCLPIPFLIIHFNIILPSKLMSSKRSLSLRSQGKALYAHSYCCSSPNIMMMKSISVRVTRIVEKTNGYRVLVGEDVGKRPLRTRQRCGVNVQIDLKRNKVGLCGPE